MKEFTFANPPDGRCDDHLLGEIQGDLAGRETILDLIKAYSDEVAAHWRVDAPPFAKLGELFNRGLAPVSMDGYYHGAAVAFQNEGHLRTFGVNTLNLAWPLARHFSPWTGKTFESIGVERLRALTDGFETGEVATFWGANTYTGQTLKQKAAIEAMRLAQVEIERATKDEQARGYEVKSFFFIARLAQSVNAENGTKTVFQFNYRWPRLHTMPPDHYCIDELVQIAEGLYLGQLVYATALLEKYDPRKPPAVYQYRNFGYFLLMNDRWYARKLKIGFDLTPSEVPV
ncbi:MAG: hypothetical protein JNN08_14600 [Bryobacterales bacterium]|nr:hypothetical protein [Bryobacterales bacterium]